MQNHVNDPQRIQPEELNDNEKTLISLAADARRKGADDLAKTLEYDIPLGALYLVDELANIPQQTSDPKMEFDELDKRTQNTVVSAAEARLAGDIEKAALLEMYIPEEAEYLVKQMVSDTREQRRTAQNSKKNRTNADYRIEFLNLDKREGEAVKMAAAGRLNGNYEMEQTFTDYVSPEARHLIPEMAVTLRRVNLIRKVFFASVILLAIYGLLVILGWL